MIPQIPEYDPPEEIKFSESDKKKIFFHKQKVAAWKKFIQQKCLKLYHLRWANGEHKPPIIKDESDLIEQLQSFKGQRKNGKYPNYFITITTTEDKDKNEFIASIKKLFENSVIEKGYLVFEQRGICEEEIGKGIHAHLLVFRDTKKYNHSKFTNRLLGQLVKLKVNKTYTSVKGLLLKASKKHSTFSFQNIKDETVSKKIAYIEGDKNEEKLEKVKMDKVFRLKYKLENIYKKKLS